MVNYLDGASSGDRDDGLLGQILVGLAVDECSQFFLVHFAGAFDSVGR